MSNRPITTSSSDPGRQYTTKHSTQSHMRYWSRSEFLQILKDTGDISRMGGERALRTGTLARIVRHARSIGFVNITLYEDGDPFFKDWASPAEDAEQRYQIGRELFKGSVKAKQYWDLTNKGVK